MTSIIKVDQIQDTGGNNIVTSNGSGAITSASFGKIAQVKSTTVTDTFSVVAGGASQVTVTGFNVSITPSSTNSKILIFVNADIGTSGDNAMGISLFRGTTKICQGDAAGNRPRYQAMFGLEASSHTWTGLVVSTMFLDSPASTAQQTYSIKFGGNGSATMYLNRTGRDINNTNEDGRGTSTITAMEVLA